MSWNVDTNRYCRLVGRWSGLEHDTNDTVSPLTRRQARRMSLAYLLVMYSATIR